MLNKDHAGFHPQRWSEAVHQLSAGQTDYVLVTLMGTAGSVPRAAGTKMVVTADSIYDTVGGGHLEFLIIETARDMLSGQGDAQRLEHFPLGASLGQCCGGSVSVLFERMTHDALAIDVYGAGHVANQLIPLLGQLPVTVRWIDSRAELFPAQLPQNVTVVIDDEPEQQVRHALPGTAFIVLTHNHQLDFALTEKILKRDDAAFLGVIGSQTKAKRFRLRLQHKQFPAERIEFMTCPVGLPSVTGKLPMEVAVSICGQLIALYQQGAHKRLRQGLPWKTLKTELQAVETNVE